MSDETQVADEGNAPDEERPEWLPDNFKTPQDVLASYEEAQRKMSQEVSARKALEDNYASLSARLEEMEAAQQHPQIDPDQQRNQLYEAYEANPLETMQWLAAQTAQQAVQQYQQSQQQQFQSIQQSQQNTAANQAVQALEVKYPDWNNYGDQIYEVAKQDGTLAGDVLLDPAAIAQKLEIAYFAAKGKESLAGGNPQGQSLEAMQHAMKLQAQTASGGGGRPTDPDANKAEWDAVIKAAKSEPGRYWE